MHYFIIDTDKFTSIPQLVTDSTKYMKKGKKIKETAHPQINEIGAGELICTTKRQNSLFLKDIRREFI